MTIFSQIPGELDFELGYMDDANIVFQFASGTFSALHSYAANVVEQDEVEIPIVVSGTGSYYDQLTLYIRDAHTSNPNPGQEWYLEITESGASRRWYSGKWTIKKYPP